MENEIRLERFQESIHCYYRIELKDSDYFENVEYRMICRNRWESFLPVLLRERDGRRWALYRADGRISLEERSRQSDLTLAICRELVKSVLRVMEICRENMLELSRVCFKPEYIFLDLNKGCSWCYLPYSSDHVKTDFEELAAWLLSKVDYDDSESVRFVYHLHWCVRKEDVSEKILKNCLMNCDNWMGTDSRISGAQEGDNREPDLAEIWASANAASAEDREMYQQMEAGSADREVNRKRNGCEKRPDVPEWITDDFGQTEDKKDKKADQTGSGSVLDQESKKRKAGRIITFVLCLLCLLGVGVLLYIGNTYSFTRMNARYMMALLLAASVFGTASYLLSSQKNDQLDGENLDVNLEERRGERVESQRKEGNGQEAYSTIRGYPAEDECVLSRASQNYGMVEYGAGIADSYSFGGDITEEDGTVVLGIHKTDRLPSLQDINSGELRTIHDDPWYIGSDKGKCHLWIDTRTVSRRHAKIYRSKESNEILIMDLNSTNGTKVNGITLLPEVARSLTDGDTIGFAERQYRFLGS